MANGVSTAKTANGSSSTARSGATWTARRRTAPCGSPPAATPSSASSCLATRGSPGSARWNGRRATPPSRLSRPPPFRTRRATGSVLRPSPRTSRSNWGRSAATGCPGRPTCVNPPSISSACGAPGPTASGMSRRERRWACGWTAVMSGSSTASANGAGCSTRSPSPSGSLPAVTASSCEAQMRTSTSSTRRACGCGAWARTARTKRSPSRRTSPAKACGGEERGRSGQSRATPAAGAVAMR